MPEQPKEKLGSPEVQARCCLQYGFVWLPQAVRLDQPRGATLQRSSKVVLNSPDFILADRHSSGQDLWFLSF